MRTALEQDKLHKLYDRVAGRYDFQHTLLTARSDQRGRKLLVDRAVQQGQNILDCGAGTGTTGLLAAKKTGVEGKVTLFDLSDGMLAVARRKAIQAQLEQRIDFRVGDMTNLPFADESFDVVLSTYSLCPVHNPEKATTEIFRVTRPGGRIGIAHSTEPEQPAVKRLADWVEDAIWRVPSLSLGCRSVAVLPTLESLGCTPLFSARIGVPLWPFLVCVVQKPATGQAGGEVSA